MKINNETQALNDTLNKMDLIDICRTFHPNATEYTSQVLMEYSPDRSYLGSQIKPQ